MRNYACVLLKKEEEKSAYEGLLRNCVAAEKRERSKERKQRIRERMMRSPGEEKKKRVGRVKGKGSDRKGPEEVGQ